VVVDGIIMREEKVGEKFMTAEECQSFKLHNRVIVGLSVEVYQSSSGHGLIQFYHNYWHTNVTCYSNFFFFL